MSDDILNIEVDGKLRGDAPATVQNMLARFPIHAVQGPPGTGKTTGH